MGLYFFGFVDLRLCGFVAVWFRGFVALCLLWLYGSNVLRLCRIVTLCLCVIVALFLCGVADSWFCCLCFSAFAVVVRSLCLFPPSNRRKRQDLTQVDLGRRRARANNIGDINNNNQPEAKQPENMRPMDNVTLAQLRGIFKMLCWGCLMTGR